MSWEKVYFIKIGLNTKVYIEEKIRSDQKREISSVVIIKFDLHKGKIWDTEGPIFKNDKKRSKIVPIALLLLAVEGRFWLRRSFVVVMLGFPDEVTVEGAGPEIKYSNCKYLVLY